MAEGYTSLQVDSRTFGEMQQRLLDDLNRPDLSGVVINYLQDAMRFFQRKPFFFNDMDNTVVPAWAANTNYPQGSTIFFSSGGSTWVAVASNAGKSGATIPTFTTNLFTPPTGSNQFPPPAVATVGTTDDNGGPPTGIRWLTIVNASAANQTQNYWTQLSTVYSINQYTPPIDYVSPNLVEVTAASMRYQLEPLSYPELRELDVIRPSPVTVYPTFWAWYQQSIYLWPYPNASYPLTLSYRSAPQIVRQTQESNFWTTDAEAMVRAYAEYLIQMRVLKDPDAAQASLLISRQEENAIVSQGISQDSLGGIPATEW
jgi:hypothetical protein